MSSPDHKPIAKILCDVCKTKRTTSINLPKNRGGRTITVVAHSDMCTSEKIEFCMQTIFSGSYSYYSSKCCKPVKGTARGGHTYKPGTPLCGLHLGVETRARAAYEAQRSAAEVAAYLRDQMEEKIKFVKQETGIELALYYRRGYGNDSYKQWLDNEWVLVKVDQLIQAIDIEVE